MIFAHTTVSSIVRQMTAATTGVIGLWNMSRSTSMIFKKFAAASVAPQITPTRISFQTTFGRSANPISSSEMPRMTVTLA